MANVKNVISSRSVNIETHTGDTHLCISRYVNNCSSGHTSIKLKEVEDILLWNMIIFMYRK
jgi:hypothetical protein